VRFIEVGDVYLTTAMKRSRQKVGLVLVRGDLSYEYRFLDVEGANHRQHPISSVVCEPTREQSGFFGEIIVPAVPKYNAFDRTEPFS
jgi:hypothetical protein